jgi:two-component system cell cycle sensor histidine kinase/response regulator CckA
LKNCGYKILLANQPKDALATAENYHEPIHLVVTDVVMPDIRGPELADRLVGSHPEAKILFMSGYTDHSISDLRLLEHRRAFLQKPFTPAIFSRKVREVLDSSSLPLQGGPMPDPGNATSAYL